jgi:competence protein ComEC
MNWKAAPFVRLLPALSLGIIAGAGLEELPAGTLSAGLTVMVAITGLLALVRTTYRLRLLFGATAQVSLFLLGLMLTHFHEEINAADHLGRRPSHSAALAGRVERVWPGDGRIRLVLGVRAWADSSLAWNECRGKLLVYLDRDSLSPLPRPGDMLLTRSETTDMPPPRNPEAFDYAGYMRYQKVYHRTFAKKDEWALAPSEKATGLGVRLGRWREKMLGILKRRIGHGDEFAVGAALILGYKDEITEEVRDAYAGTGAIHVLAVSGLHVGLVYLGLNFLLGALGLSRRRWVIIKTCLLIAGVWAYALLTGGSPSVLRAATMFSFIILGRALQRSSGIYNTLAASAFCLLCIQPFLLMSVGFQLSYLAVAGIVYFQPRIYRLIYIKNRFFDNIWKLMAVSLAAQITTTPLSMFYFHQFPVFFWLSGLIVVPAAGFILGGGLLTIALDLLPWAGEIAGSAVFWLIRIVNQAIFLIHQLPGSLIKGIWIEPVTAGLIYIALLTLIAALESRRMRWALATLGLVAGMALLNALTLWQQSHRKEIAVYFLPPHTAIDLVSGRRVVSLTSVDAPEERIAMAAQNFRWSRKMKRLQHVSLGQEEAGGADWRYRNGLLQFYDQRILIIDAGILSHDSFPPIRADYVVIRNNPQIRIGDMRKAVQFRHLIIDASNSARRASRWKEECRELGIEVTDIYREGGRVIGF